MQTFFLANFLSSFSPLMTHSTCSGVSTLGCLVLGDHQLKPLQASRLHLLVFGKHVGVKVPPLLEPWARLHDPESFRIGSRHPLRSQSDENEISKALRGKSRLTILSTDSAEMTCSGHLTIISKSLADKEVSVCRFSIKRRHRNESVRYRCDIYRCNVTELKSSLYSWQPAF